MANNVELVSEYVDRTGVVSDTKFLVEQVNQAIAAFNRLNGIKVGLGGTESLSKTIPATRELSNATSDYEKQLQRVEDRIASMNGKSKEFTQILLTEAKIAKENSIAKLNEAKAREINEKAADREAAAIDRATKAKERDNLTVSKGAASNTSGSTSGATPKDNYSGPLYDTSSTQGNNSSTKLIKEEEKAVEDLTKEIDIQLNSIQKLGLERAKNAKGLKDQQALMKRDVQLLKEGSITRAEYNQRLGQGQVNIATYKNRISELDLEIKKQTKSITQANSAYRDLELKQAIATKRAKDLASTYGEFSKQARVAQSEAAYFAKRLAAVDAQVGQNQRNVGNYAGGINKAFGIIRQAAYILPGIGLAGIFNAIGEGIIFLYNAIKGEDVIPDAVRKIKAYIEVVKEAGSAFVSASTNVASLTNLIKLSKEGFIDKEKVVKFYNESIGKTTGQVNSLEQAEAALIKNKKIYIEMMLQKAIANEAYAQAAKKSFEAATAQLDDNTTFVDKAKVAAKSFLRVITDPLGVGSGGQKEVKRVADELAADQDKRTAKRKDKLAKDAQAFTDIAVQAETDAVKLANQIGADYFGNTDDKKKQAKDYEDMLAKYNDEIRKLMFENQKRILQDEIDAARSIIANDDLTFEKRLKAAQTFYDKSAELARAEQGYQIEDIFKDEEEEKRKANLQIKDASILQQTLTAITEKAIQRRLLVQGNYNSAIQKAALSYANFTKDLQEKELKKAEDHRLALNEIATQDIKNSYDQALLDLDDRYSREVEKAKGNAEKLAKVEKDYQRDRLNLQSQLQIDLLTNDIEFTKKTIELAEARALASGKQEDVDAVAKAKAKLQALEIEQGKVITDNIIRNNKSKTDSDKEYFAKLEKNLRDIAAIAIQVSDILSNIGGIRAEKDKNEIEEQIKALEELREKQLAIEESRVQSADERAAAIAAIEARTQAKRDILERKQAQAEERRARFDKAANISRIAIETTLAVVHQLASGDPYTATFRAIAAGALGAAQLAIAIATPIPKYKDGTKNHPGGPAVVGDGGKSELIEYPDGSMRITGSQSEVLNLPRHTIVHPDAELAIMMGKASINQRGQVVRGAGSDMSGVRRDLRAIAKAINDKTENHFTTESPLNSFFKTRGGSRFDYLNRHR